jgi:7-carboxy-7-deazaguanine synthase
MEAQAAVEQRKGKEFLLSECYVSVQGESSLVGVPTVFVRLYTCNLRCRWCDSMHAVEGGDFTRIGVEAAVRRIFDLAGDERASGGRIRNICWTGGEPLLQGESIARAIRRLPESFVHSIETDGEIDLGAFDALVAEERAAGRVRYVMDVKCPGSGMVANRAYRNLERLRVHDEVKFVLLDRADYEFAKGVLSKVDTRSQTILFSPATPAHKVHRGLDAGQLASWILEERLPVRLQLQMHKLIWPGRDRGI